MTLLLFELNSICNAQVLIDMSKVPVGSGKFSGPTFANTACYGDVSYTGYTSTGTTSTAQRYTAMDGGTMGSESNSQYLITMGVDIQSLGFDVQYQHWLGSGHKWSSWYLNGTGPQGFTGSPVKALKIQLVNAPGYHIEYRIRVDGKGWQDWLKDGAEASYHRDILGYRKITAIQVRLTGPQKTNCSIGGFDTANCHVGTPPPGTNAFIYGNAFYYTPLAGNQCPYRPFPDSGFDGANCYLTAVPTCASPFIYSNKWYVTPTY